MSIMLFDETRANKLIKGICTQRQMWTASEHFEHNSKGSLYQQGFSNSGIEKFIIECINANMASYNGRYNDNVETITSIDKNINDEPFSIYQTLKTLMFLRYNIEGEYLQDKKQAEQITKKLTAIIEDLRNIIINSIPDFDGAEWG